MKTEQTKGRKALRRVPLGCLCKFLFSFHLDFISDGLCAVGKIKLFFFFPEAAFGCGVYYSSRNQLEYIAKVREHMAHDYFALYNTFIYNSFFTDTLFYEVNSDIE